jgi:hypothetical protein
VAAPTPVWPTTGSAKFATIRSYASDLDARRARPSRRPRSSRGRGRGRPWARDEPAVRPDGRPRRRH